MLDVVPATYKGPLVLLLLPYPLPLLLALFPDKGLWHPATVTVLSGLIQCKEGRNCWRFSAEHGTLFCP